MYELKVENRFGEIFTLTGRESEYQIVEVDGLTPPNAILSTSTIVNMDGEKFNSSKLGARNIVITVKINGDVETNRIRLYRYFETKQYCKIYYKNSTRDIFAEGYVETFDGSMFVINQTMQISIVCHDPYLQSVEEIFSDISKLLGLFEFPFAFGAGGVVEGTTTDPAIEFGEYDENRIVNIFNEGADTGLIMRFTVNGGNVINPKFHDVYTREFFGLNMTLLNQDIVEINTNKGKKFVTLTRAGETINIINNMMANSTWFTLRKGDNMYTYEAEEGAQYLSSYFTHRTRYQGV